jgi:hypothetical protein
LADVQAVNQSVIYVYGHGHASLACGFGHLAEWDAGTTLWGRRCELSSVRERCEVDPGKRWVKDGVPDAVGDKITGGTNPFGFAVGGIEEILKILVIAKVAVAEGAVASSDGRGGVDAVIDKDGALFDAVSEALNSMRGD